MNIPDKETVMPQVRATVRTHTKVSSTGKKFTVRQHARRVTVGDLIDRAVKGGVSGRVTAGAVGASATLALWWSLNAVFSTIAALMMAITMVMLSVLGLAAKSMGVKKKRRKKWFPSWSGSMSPKKRMKLWAHRKKTRLLNSISIMTKEQKRVHARKQKKREVWK